MALTITYPGDWSGVAGNQRQHRVTSDFDASYPTGGEPLTPGDLGLRVVNRLEASPKSGFIFEYDKTNEKLLAYYADYDAVADGALIQVADTTDLSAVTGVEIMAWGY